MIYGLQPKKYKASVVVRFFIFFIYHGNQESGNSKRPRCLSS